LSPSASELIGNRLGSQPLLEQQCPNSRAGFQPALEFGHFR
jgi:hypothetical protein